MTYPTKTRPTKDDLWDFYIERGCSAAQMAEHYECSWKTIVAWLKYYGIAVRTVAQAQKLAQYQGRVGNLKKKVARFFDEASGTWKKACCSCKEIKALGEFNFRGEEAYAKNVRASCKQCSHIQATRTRRMKLYGLSHEAYMAMLRGQHGVCAICRDLPTNDTRLCVDHDHATGAVRGLLCVRCNTALGKLQESLPLIGRLYRYVKERKGHFSFKDKSSRE